MKKVVISAAFIFLLSGCTSNPYNVMNNKKSFDYEVDAPFAVVYDRLQIGSKRCFESYSGLDLSVHSGLTDSNKARLHVTGMNNYTLAVLEVTTLDGDRTAVRGTWTQNIASSWYKRIVASKNWSNGLYMYCERLPEQL